MNQNLLVAAIVAKVRNGNPVFFGGGHMGRVKIKVKYGALSLFTKRYFTDFVTFEKIKAQLKGRIRDIQLVG